MYYYPFTGILKHEALGHSSSSIQCIQIKFHTLYADCFYHVYALLFIIISMYSSHEICVCLCARKIALIYAGFEPVTHGSDDTLHG